MKCFSEQFAVAADLQVLENQKISDKIE